MGDARERQAEALGRPQRARELRDVGDRDVVGVERLAARLADGIWVMREHVKSRRRGTAHATQPARGLAHARRVAPSAPACGAGAPVEGRVAEGRGACGHDQCVGPNRLHARVERVQHAAVVPGANVRPRRPIAGRGTGRGWARSRLGRHGRAAGRCRGVPGRGAREPAGERHAVVRERGGIRHPAAALRAGRAVGPLGPARGAGERRERP